MYLTARPALHIILSCVCCVFRVLRVFGSTSTVVYKKKDRDRKKRLRFGAARATTGARANGARNLRCGGAWPLESQKADLCMVCTQKRGGWKGGDDV
jgi:hypothetical protein